MQKAAFGCLAIILVGFLLVVVTAISTYNGLVTASQGVDAQWAQVQNVYQRRADLVPNLVSTVAGAANFEKSTLTEITAARAGTVRAARDRLVLDSGRS